VARALADDVRAAGGQVVTSCAVSGAGNRSRQIEVKHVHGVTSAAQAVFCAGLWSDRLAVAAGAPADPRIVPFRGAYLRLREEKRRLVRSLIYPVPDPQLPFLGVHLTRHIDGEVLVGPTALLVGARDAYSLRRVSAADVGATLAWPGSWRMFRRWWRTGVVEMRHAASRRRFVAEAARYVPALRTSDVLPGPAGVRAVGDHAGDRQR
jgi:(S)-2-hydroxyglutarate dehydrogenase